MLLRSLRGSRDRDLQHAARPGRCHHATGHRRGVVADRAGPVSTACTQVVSAITSPQPLARRSSLSTGRPGRIGGVYRAVRISVDGPVGTRNRGRCSSSLAGPITSKGDWARHCRSSGKTSAGWALHHSNSPQPVDQRDRTFRLSLRVVEACRSGVMSAVDASRERIRTRNRNSAQDTDAEHVTDLGIDHPPAVTASFAFKPCISLHLDPEGLGESTAVSHLVTGRRQAGERLSWKTTTPMI